MNAATTVAKKWLLSLDGGSPKCAALFGGSPLIKNSWINHPAILIDEYIVWVNGEGVKDSNRRVPCREGADAWTYCCGHSRVVFICDSFTRRGVTSAAQRLIHEAMHVAGQLEDHSNSTAGPSDPPSPNHIDNAVAAACN